jgi:antibiotic biosynthesis monooxygenase (ABM) superfamily enzyme
MPAMDSTCLLFVQMTAKKDEEAAFNAWYENEYIPAFAREVPGVVRARRFKSLGPDGEGMHTYLTIYEFADEEALHRGLGVMKSREEWRARWKEWEARAIASISDNLFRTTMSVVGSAEG